MTHKEVIKVFLGIFGYKKIHHIDVRAGVGLGSRYFEVIAENDKGQQISVGQDSLPFVLSQIYKQIVKNGDIKCEANCLLSTREFLDSF